MTVLDEDIDVIADLTVEQVTEAMISTMPDEHWIDFEEATRHNCHSASLAIVRSGLFKKSRVARGTCRGIAGQHSWVVVGDDCYDRTAVILDVTAWSYGVEIGGEPVEQAWSARADWSPHVPHGAGHILEWGKPCSTGGEVVSLAPEAAGDLSVVAFSWLGLIGPLDVRGWMALANAPVEGWPSDEIILAMHRTPRLRAFVPIGRLGMLTDVNPGGLYLPGDEREDYDVLAREMVARREATGREVRR